MQSSSTLLVTLIIKLLFLAGLKIMAKLLARLFLTTLFVSLLRMSNDSCGQNFSWKFISKWDDKETKDSLSSLQNTHRVSHNKVFTSACQLVTYTQSCGTYPTKGLFKRTIHALYNTRLCMIDIV